MRITKDESRILAHALEDAMFPYNEIVSKTKSELLKNITAFENLQKRLMNFGNDRRRQGRKSQDGFDDCLERFVNSKNV